jgi:transposase
MQTRPSSPSDVSDAAWAFVAPSLTLLAEDAGPRRYPLREGCNAPRSLVHTGAPWRGLPHDFPPWPLVYQQTQRWLTAGAFEALMHDLRLLRAAAREGIERRVVQRRVIQRGGVLLPKRWISERDFAWAWRLRRLARDDERLPTVLAGLRFVVFTCLVLHRLIPLISSP